MGEVPIDELRKLLVKELELAGPAEPVESIQEIAVPGPGDDIPVRLYRSATRPLGVVVYLHGGGWALGTLDHVDVICRSLANLTGCAVASVEYALAPERRFPAGLEDAYAATVWAAEYAHALGAEVVDLAIAGDSAGGNLAAAVALLARDRGYPQLRHQTLIYPVLDHGFDTPSHRAYRDGYWLTQEELQWCWATYLPSLAHAADPLASPLRADSLTGLPPAFILTAEFDPLRSEAESYAARLQASGVPVRLTCYTGLIHGFLICGRYISQVRPALEQIAAEIVTALSQRLD